MAEEALSIAQKTLRAQEDSSTPLSDGTMSKVTFTIRRNYFDMVRQGLKTNEIRRASEWWRSVAARQPQPTEAVFLCGRQPAHRRAILRIAIEEGDGAAEKILGRPLSSQGVLDVGTGSVVVFWLGKEMP